MLYSLMFPGAPPLFLLISRAISRLRPESVCLRGAKSGLGARTDRCDRHDVERSNRADSLPTTNRRSDQDRRPERKTRARDLSPGLIYDSYCRQSLLPQDRQSQRILRQVAQNEHIRKIGWGGVIIVTFGSLLTLLYQGAAGVPRSPHGPGVCPSLLRESSYAL